MLASVLQLLTKIGVLPPLPIWVDAGKVWIESHPSFPLGMLVKVSPMQMLPHNFTAFTLSTHIMQLCKMTCGG